MNLKQSVVLGAVMATLGLVTSNAQASCGTAVCPINTQWEMQGAWTQPGWRADLRIEYIDQDQPRAGRKKVDVGDIPRHHDEVRTINRNSIATLDYTIDAHWGVTAVLSWVDRDHRHIHNHMGAQLPEAWNLSEFGDARLLGRHQWVRSSSDSHGVVFGLKLPTGKTDVKNDEGELAERSLQPGSGTTDAIVGFFANTRFAAGGKALGGFVQAQVQAPINEHDDYKPGAQYLIDAGLSYAFNARWTGLLQANVVIRDRDKGDEAEPEDTGGTFLWLSPGASYAASKNTRVYGFVQLPIYQRVNGVQLTADWAAAIGASWRF